MLKPASCQPIIHKITARCMLINGDAISVVPRIKNTIDLLLTDIPYGEVNRSTQGLREIDKGVADNVTFDLECFLSKVNILSPKSIYVFCAWEQLSGIVKNLREHNYSVRVCVWEKSNPSPMNGQYIWLSGIELAVYGKQKNATFNEHCKTPIFKYARESNKFHPTQKPIKLLEYLINVSTNENDLVLDCCFGSCNTGIASLKLNRKFIGIELNSELFDIGYSRVKQCLNL